MTDQNDLFAGGAALGIALLAANRASADDGTGSDGDGSDGGSDDPTPSYDPRFELVAEKASEDPAARTATYRFQAVNIDTASAIEGVYWDVDGEAFTGQTVDFTFASSGSYVVKCRVMDTEGRYTQKQDTIDVTVPTGAENGQLAYYGGTSAVWEQTIYTSKDVYDNTDRYPEEAFAVYLHETLKSHGISHEITFDYPLVSIYNDDPSCCDPQDNPDGCDSDQSRAAVYEFEDEVEAGNVPYVAKDSNILVINSWGGGCASVGGNIGVAGGAPLDGPIDYETPRVDLRGHSIHSFLHEVGHNMGYSHSEAWGTGEYADGYFRVSPCMSPGQNDMTGKCGQWIPAREGRNRQFTLHYSGCTISNMQIESGSVREGTDARGAEGDPLCGCNH